jgi:hypothetical protein
MVRFTQLIANQNLGPHITYPHQSHKQLQGWETYKNSYIHKIARMVIVKNILLGYWAVAY